MHHFFDRSREVASVCWPHTAGGHSHKAPATSDTMRGVAGAYSFANTVTLKFASNNFHAVVRPLTPPPMTRTCLFLWLLRGCSRSPELLLSLLLPESSNLVHLPLDTIV
ncbi:hypothetical protein Mapa_013644 [Marchantia paleacea]|nr:hypothetical protein Mapa_013644 [Marchantia paleacea]